MAQRFLQSFSIKLFDTYPHVARRISFCVIYALTVYLNLFIKGINVDVAFLTGELKGNVYIEPLTGYKLVAKRLFLELNRAQYGLKNCTREGNLALNKFL